MITSLASAFNPAAAQDDKIPLPQSVAGVALNDNSPLLREFSRTPQGAALAAFAAAHNIRIIYDGNIEARGEYGEYTAQDNTVRLMRGLPLQEQAVYLAHELRHAWQDKVLDYTAFEQRGLSPQQRFTLRRYLEADAFAFSAQFLAERMTQLGAPPSPQTTIYEYAAAKNLAAARDAAGNISPGNYRRLALEPAFAHLGNYNLQHVAVAAAVFDDRKTLLQRKAGAPENDAFAAFLRHFGGMTLDAAAPTVLPSAQVTNETLLTDYPRRSLDAEAPPLLSTGIAAAVSPAPPLERLERLARLQAKWLSLQKPEKTPGP